MTLEPERVIGQLIDRECYALEQDYILSSLCLNIALIIQLTVNLLAYPPMRYSSVGEVDCEEACITTHNKIA